MHETRDIRTEGAGSQIRSLPGNTSKPGFLNARRAIPLGIQTRINHGNNTPTTPGANLNWPLRARTRQQRECLGLASVMDEGPYTVSEVFFLHFFFEFSYASCKVALLRFRPINRFVQFLDGVSVIHALER
jgi:hypothetical protein